MALNQETILNEFAFLVSETDERGIIRFANEDFCKIAEYSLEELIGTNHNVVRHKDMPQAAFQDLWDTVKKGDTWSGYVKNSTKSGGFYWVYATVYPFVSNDGKEGYLSCRRRATKAEIEEAQNLYASMK